MYIDTHTHLYYEKIISQLDDILNRAKINLVSKIICVGTNLENSKKCVDLSKKYDSIFGSVGIHPQDCIVKDKVEIGPYARIRPNTILEKGSKVGNFVEIKKSKIGKNSKVNHLTYIGDANIGKNVNVGAGTITCNYDGIKKSKTFIKDNVFIGSNSSLVAPLTLEEGSTIGAGSVITKKVKRKSLALTRSLQTEVKNYKRKRK